MERVVRIGTRDSKLALWQATKVEAMLKAKGIACTIVKVKSEGDLDLVTPLYAMGVEGVFTKTLDAYLLSNKIDIAVHSMKDVPIELAKGTVKCAVLKRANYRDLLVYKEDRFVQKFLSNDSQEQASLEGIIATGSIRRKAALLHKFPKLTVVNLRGNVQSRMQKLQNNDWDGAIFAAAGLERIEERPANAIELDWMLPAPAQGAIMVCCRADEPAQKQWHTILHDTPTDICVTAERDFLKTLMGGCSTPIAALATIYHEAMIFKGSILSLNGHEQMEVERKIPLAKSTNIGIECANELLHKGALRIIEAISMLKKQ